MAAADRHEMHDSGPLERVLHLCGVCGIDVGAIAFGRHVVLSENTQCQSGDEHFPLVGKTCGLDEERLLHHADGAHRQVWRPDVFDCRDVGQPQRHGTVSRFGDAARDLVGAVLFEFAAFRRSAYIRARAELVCRTPSMVSDVMRASARQSLDRLSEMTVGEVARAVTTTEASPSAAAREAGSRHCSKS